jgi:DUF1009 family protein
LGILAGQGTLPLALAAAHPGALFLRFDAGDMPDGIETARVSYERFGALFDTLRAAGVTEVVFAGGLARPALNPANFDAKMTELAPRFLAAMQGGDDGLLRAVIAAFEAHGFAVRGAHALLPALTAQPGVLAGAPSKPDMQDVARARAVLAALGPLDVGQGAVVAQGQALGIETLQGTDAMLRFVAETRPATLPGGVLVKAPKPGQDLRVDMPAIGPATVALCAQAGLRGIAIDAGQVLLIERDALVAEAEGAGLFVVAEAP